MTTVDDDEPKWKELDERAVSFMRVAHERVFTAATATLALSVTFRQSLVGQSTHGVWILPIAWGLLIICIVTGIAKLRTMSNCAQHMAVSFRSCAREMNLVKPAVRESMLADAKAQMYDMWELRTFIGAIMLFVLFATINVLFANSVVQSQAPVIINNMK